MRLVDPKLGELELHGLLAHAPGSQEIVVLVHGLGGDVGSHYMIGAARAAYAANLSSLRVNLRGADFSGDDFYHAGLVSDLEAVLRSTRLTRYDRIYVLGFSLGGHLALRAAEGKLDPRVVSVAAICPPLDLDRSATFIDSPEAWMYRSYVLKNLVEQYAPVAKKRHLAPSAEEAAQIRSIRVWDQKIVAPRWGFASAEHYYAMASAGPHLEELTVPSLLVVGEEDPMVPPSTIDPILAKHRSEKLVVRRVAGAGHIGFPDAIDPEILAWLRDPKTGA